MALLPLDEGWLLREAPLRWDASFLPRALQEQPVPCGLPCDVRMALMDAGRIDDPLVGVNFRDQLWVERRSWWFEKRFQWSGEAHDRVELTLDRLDWGADIFLNGIHLGRHDSVFYPFVADVGAQLKAGENQLVVRLTCGLEGVTDADVAELDWQACTEASNGCPERGDHRRAFLRKPAYAFGWDWGPRVATCGIGSAHIQAHDGAAVRHAMMSTRSVEGGTATVRVSAEVESLLPLSTQDGEVEISLSLDGDIAACQTRRDVLLTSGLNWLDFTLEVPNAALWYPNGYGEQPLYELRVAVRTAGGESRLSRMAGLRTLEMDTRRLEDGTRRFALAVNGRPVMSKGGNWIPSDSIYARVTPQKYEKLVAEAKEANFTMLRVWGGGLYENDIFYELCDRAGILVWQDFMFGCSLIPDHRGDFCALVERELEYQTRRLGGHACLGLFCGNNENQMIYVDWMKKDRRHGGLHVYNRLAPQAVRRNCPHVPYWSSSPYGGANPNDNDVGDRHHWNDCTMNPDMERRITPEEYDKVTSRFISEYGYIGPCSRESIEAFFGGAPIDRSGDIWSAHNNTFEKHTVAAGITKHYVDAEGLKLTDYLLYAGAVQALMLGYSLEAIRNKPECWGALFWMYNDCWGETGWTIVDYYLRRKPSFYAVRRAFAPRRLILRAQGGEVVVTAHNDTAQDVTLAIEYGSMAHDGSGCDTRTAQVALRAHSKAQVARFPLEGCGPLVFARAPGLDTALLRRGPYREYPAPACELTVGDVSSQGDDLHFTVTARGYAHGVHFGLGGEVRLSDEWFDLLPGESRAIVARGAAGREVQPRAINQ